MSSKNDKTINGKTVFVRSNRFFYDFLLQGDEITMRLAIGAAMSKSDLLPSYMETHGVQITWQYKPYCHEVRDKLGEITSQSFSLGYNGKIMLINANTSNFARNGRIAQNAFGKNLNIGRLTENLLDLLDQANAELVTTNSATGFLMRVRDIKEADDSSNKKYYKPANVDIDIVVGAGDVEHARQMIISQLAKANDYANIGLFAANNEVVEVEQTTVSPTDYLDLREKFKTFKAEYNSDESKALRKKEYLAKQAQEKAQEKVLADKTPKVQAKAKK